MGINIYIAEDNPEQCDQLVQAVKNYTLFSNWEMKISGVADSGEDLLKMIDYKNQWNVYFLDINLVQGDEIENGFTLAQKIRTFDPLGFIVFITVRSEFSFLTFLYRIQALDFILKESTVNIQERVHSCLKTVEDRLSMLSDENTINLSVGNEIQSFITKDILYMAANKNAVLSLYTLQKEYPIYQETLTGLESKLGEDFLRSHRGFLVNRRAILQVSKDFKEIILIDHSVIPISARQKNRIKKAINQNLENKLNYTLNQIKS
ncbi:LytR/AlgR family response regulator transcription factor [Enterococcus sp. LJL120]